MASSKPKEPGDSGSSENLLALSGSDVAETKKKPLENATAPADSGSTSPTLQHGDMVRGSLHQGSATQPDLRLDAQGSDTPAPASETTTTDFDPYAAAPSSTDAPQPPVQIASLEAASDMGTLTHPDASPEGSPQGSSALISGPSAADAQEGFKPSAPEMSAADPLSSGPASASTTEGDEGSADDQAAAPSLTAKPAVGDEDTEIPLDIRAVLGDTDGSETLSIEISGVPNGAVLSAGIDNGDGSWMLTPEQLQGLTITPPPDSDADFTLTVTATATESNGSATTTTSAELSVTVNGVADAPSVAVSPAAGAEDTAIPLDISAALNDFDGSESLQITISNLPSGAILSAGTANADGSWTLTPAQLQALTITPPADSDGEFTLTVAVTSTEAESGDTFTLTAQMPVSVAAVADVPALAVSPAAGAEDSAIPLNITSALTDLDGSESLSINISGVPSGAILSAGTANVDGSWTLTPAQLQGLKITPPANSDGDFTLTVTATSTETDGGTAVVTAQVPVTVTAVADAPTLVAGPATGSEDSAIPLNITSALTDLDGSENLSINISGVPSGAILSAGAANVDGSWTLTPAQLQGLTITPPASSDGDFTLTVTATSSETDGGTAVVTAQIPITVTAVADAPVLTVGDVEFEPGTTVDFPIDAALVDIDGSEALSVTISGLPSGAVLSAGQLGSDGSWTLSQSDLAGLKLTLPGGFRGEYPIEVTATSTEASNGDTETVTGQFNLTVDRDMSIVISHAVLPDGSQDTSDSYVIGEAPGTTRTYTGSDMQIAGVGNSSAVVVAQDGAGNVDIAVSSAWGSVRNFQIDDDQPRNVTIRNFVDAEVTLGDGGPSVVSVIDAKGGKIVTGDGADTVTVVARSDSAGGPVSNELEISTGAGNDVIRVTAATNGLTRPLIDGGDGADTIEVLGTSADRVFGGVGDDRILTNAGDDIVDGGSGNNYIDTGSGNNQVIAGAGDDTIYAGAGNDVINAGDGDNFVNAGNGTNTVTTGDGNDRIVTGTGNDTIQAGGGDDIIDGGTGTDTASYTMAAAGVAVSLALTTAQNTIGAGTDTLTGIENLAGSDFDDVLTGNGNVNVLTGGAGADILDGGAGNDTLIGGSGNDTLIGGLGNDVIAGGADIDTASYAAATAAVTVNLATTAAQNTGGGGTDTISGIENLIGSAFNDVLTGDGANNVLFGGAGNDTLAGGLGDDVIDGGIGTDTASYATATSAVTVNLALTTAQNTVGAGIDTLIGIENLTGSGFNDLLTGNAGNNLIAGGAGNDTLDGGAGDDILDGGTGTDTAVYTTAASAVTVNLALTTAQNTGGAGTDRLVAVENLTGSGFDDVLTGNSGANVLTGGAGTDTLDGGAGNDTLRGGAGNDTLTGGVGNDVIDGGADTDTASYAAATAAVTVSLATTTAQNTRGAGTDTLTSVENLTGSGFNDTLTGDASNNMLAGEAGNDTLRGGAGDDTLIGGAGNDTLDGGTGIDTASYSTATAGVTVSLATTTAQNTGGAGTDTLTVIENLTGSGFDDVLSGNSADNVLVGGAGNDTLNGGAGADVLDGGVGNDSAIGGAGDDIYRFDLGNGHDSFDGGTGWTDRIDLGNVSQGPGTGEWVLDLTQGSVISNGDGQIVLSADAVGTIQLSDGSVLDFGGVETITW